LYYYLLGASTTEIRYFYDLAFCGTIDPTNLPKLTTASIAEVGAVSETIVGSITRRDSCLEG
jgi:hypothetical protein